MAGGTREEDDQGSRLTEEAALSARLRRLSDRLDRSTTARSPTPTSSPFVDRSGFSRGLRLSSEFIVGVLVGAVVGWAVDHWLRTSPFGLIGLTLLGFVAAVVNLVRTSSSGARPQVNDANQRSQD